MVDSMPAGGNRVSVDSVRRYEVEGEESRIRETSEPDLRCVESIKSEYTGREGWQLTASVMEFVRIGAPP
jgi:hypothetical protein